ncbi:sodium:calcium antiporter [Pseudolabrys sp. FHR47]|uniref:sodium:calcium antiporter n=1 Tax=Pseudolabrys sp. FHR47 TaxID=2562284 RepID=UPI0010BEF0A8|nr:sodium:calcium antiporter [Pseudolabrys sp. FHR47]
MTALLLPWLKFVLCVAAIGFAGPMLTRYGDVIAQLTGLSRSWIGLVLLATATSLPELFTGLSAVTVADAPDIAVGDVLGSCVFNLVMLVLLDELSRDEPMYRRVDQGHILTAGFGVILIGTAGALLLLSQNGLHASFLHISVYTPIILLIYFVAMRAAFVYERSTPRPPSNIAPPRGILLSAALVRYGAAAAVVVVAGTWLPFIGNEIADIMGWRQSFVGTLLIASATSVPELVVTLSALRLGAVDMAIGNLLGSNLFDILVLAIDDIAYTKGPLLAAVSPAHAITAFAAVVMTGIFIVAMLYKPATRLRGTIGWVSIALLLVYLFSAYAIYLYGH